MKSNLKLEDINSQCGSVFIHLNAIENMIYEGELKSNDTLNRCLDAIRIRTRGICKTIDRIQQLPLCEWMPISSYSINRPGVKIIIKTRTSHGNEHILEATCTGENKFNISNQIVTHWLYEPDRMVFQDDM